MLILLLVCVPSIVAYADTVSGSYLYATVYNYQYQFNSTASAQTGSVWSHANIKCTQSVNVPAGYMGAYARLYNESGTLVKASGWSYNSSACAGIGIMTPSYYTSSGTYYGHGQVRMYNGNGYANYNTTKSPYIQGRSIPSNDFDVLYGLNKNNEVYGSELFLLELDITPDLIQAEGDNGEVGYVKYEDLNEDIPSDPEEAIEYQNSLPESRVIPIYDVDGETVIDTFTIYYNCIEE